MLATSKLQSIILTANIQRAEEFYSDTLGLRLLGRSHGALIYNVSGSELRVSPVPATTPSAHTVLGFAVADLNTAVDHMTERGVVWERFAGFPHDAKGVVSTPDGAKVVWFRDPDGNLLSVVQYTS